MFRIEVFFEPDLLNEPIDCWKISRSPATLGSKYIIFTRSSKRLSNYAYRPHWITKWQIIEQQNLSTENIIFTSDYSNLRQLYFNIEQEQSCILIIDKCYQKNECKQIISDLEETGIPVVIWIRENKEIFSHQIEIKELIKEKFSDLPNRIQLKRLDALKRSNNDLDKKHIGNHLTLIWENPNLYPIDIKYSSP